MSVKPLFDAFRDYISLRDEEPVRDCFDRFDWKLSERSLEPLALPGTNHLDNVLEDTGGGEKRLVNQLLQSRPQLHWRRSYTTDDFGQAFFDNYCFVELIGTRGHFASDEIAAGIVLFGPGISYPNHWHVAEEFYFPLTSDALWSRDDGPYETRKSGEFIHHESNMPHAMKPQDAPLLAAYVWRNGDLAQKSDF